MIFDIENYLKDLRDIVDVDSWSFEPKGVEKAVDVLYNKFKKIGCSVKKLRFSEAVGSCLQITNIDDEFYDGTYDVMLLGHVDTVFKQGTCHERPFKVEGNIAKGPGVADMKSGLILGYYIMKEFGMISKNGEFDSKKNNKVPKICMVIDSDEEISSSVCHDWMKGLALKSKCVLVLEPGRKDSTFVIKRKGIAEYEIDFKGRAAHAGSEPEKGINSIVEMANWVLKLNSFNNKRRGTTVNVGVVSGGTVSNVVPEYSKIRVDVRFKNSNAIKVLENAMEDMVKRPFVKGISTNVKRLDFIPPMNPNNKTQKLCKLAEKVGKEFNEDVKWQFCGGISDGNITSAVGVPTIDAMGPYGENCHNEDEYIEIDSVKGRFEFLRELISRISLEH